MFWFLAKVDNLCGKQTKRDSKIFTWQNLTKMWKMKVFSMLVTVHDFFVNQTVYLNLAKICFDQNIKKSIWVRLCLTAQKTIWTPFQDARKKLVKNNNVIAPPPPPKKKKKSTAAHHPYSLLKSKCTSKNNIFVLRSVNPLSIFSIEKKRSFTRKTLKIFFAFSEIRSVYPPIGDNRVFF